MHCLFLFVLADLKHGSVSTFENNLKVGTRQMTINKSIAEYRQEQTNPSWRKEIFNIKGKKCHICGDVEYLEIHHLIALKNGGTNNINNLLVLCQKCHKLVHNKIHKNTSKNGRPKVIEFEQAEKIYYDWI